MKKLFRNPLVRNLLYVFLGLVLLLLIFDNLIMPWYVSSPETSVPDLIGKQVSEAIDMLKKEGFDAVISDTSYGLDMEVDRKSVV